MTKQPTEPDDWSGHSEALFRSARQAHAPTAADRERVRNALAQKLAAVSGGTPTHDDVGTRLADSGVSRAALGTVTKVGLGVACVLATAVAFMRAGDSRERTDTKPIAAQTTPSGGTPAQRAAEPAEAAGDHAAPPSVALKPAIESRSRDRERARSTTRRSVESSAPAKVLEHSPERPPASAVEQPAAVESGERLSLSPSPSPPPDAPARKVDDTLDARAELEFVARINAAVRESAPQTVLALCAEHERRWPHGMFEQEREGARAIAACSSKLPGAGARARAFLANHPRTAIAARVREECAPLLTTDTRM